MSKTASVLLDVQEGILNQFKGKKTDYLSRVSEAIKVSRAAGIQIIYTRTCFRQGHPEISSRNFTAAKVASYRGFK
jgi:nicotinamidase-related amidase